MKHQLPDLPYPKDALEPHMSRETLDYHHGKHHATYVDKLNGLIADTEFAEMSLNDIVTQAQGGVYNNAAQAWNHAFFWRCLTPSGEGAPSGDLADAITRDFGGMDALRDEFEKAVTQLFGSGWVWLLRDAGGVLSVIASSNAGNPMTEGQTPLLTCDVWEHAYYIDYRNAKPKYFAGFWHLVDWDFVAENHAREDPFQA
jgi:superoxide dismutase, Fe-Mn family